MKKSVKDKLIERYEQCQSVFLAIEDKEVKSQYYGEMVGLEYAIVLLMMEEDKNENF